jgi:hypothetical protein
LDCRSSYWVYHQNKGQCYIANCTFSWTLVDSKTLAYIWYYFCCMLSTAVCVLGHVRNVKYKC